MDARHRGRDPPDARRARHRFGAVQPAGQGLPHRHGQHHHRVHPRRHPHHDPSFHRGEPGSHQALVDLITQVATAHESTPAQVALAWLLAQRPSIVPIPGTRRLQRLEENIGATRLDLSADDLAALGEAATRVGVAGARYNEEMQKMTGI